MKFKVGDKVRIKDANDISYIGKIGVIEEISSSTPHSCKLTIDGKKGSWWNAWLFDMLELVEEKSCDNCGNKIKNKRECQVCTTAILNEVKQTPNHWVPIEEEMSDVTKENDLVNHPSHYTQGKYEVIDIIEDATKDLKGIQAVCDANVLKYVLRWPYKNGIEDIKKARWYLDRLIKEVENESRTNL